MKNRVVSYYLLYGLLFLGIGSPCVLGADEGESGITTLQPTSDALPSLSKQQNKSVVGLLENAARHLNEGRLEEAAATLERALRIEPRNPAIWHYLGQTALYRGQYPQVEALAAKSNSLAGDDVEFRTRNDWLIGAARHAANKNLAPLLGQQEKRNLEVQLEQEAERRRQAEAESDRLRERLEQAGSIVLASPTDRPTTAPRRSKPADVKPQPVSTDDSTRESRKTNTVDPAIEPAERRVATYIPRRAERRVSAYIPRGHRPPPGQCRLWFPNRPPGHQPPPGNCLELEAKGVLGSWLVHSDGRYATR